MTYASAQSQQAEEPRSKPKSLTEKSTVLTMTGEQRAPNTGSGLDFLSCVWGRFICRQHTRWLGKKRDWRWETKRYCGCLSERRRRLERGHERESKETDYRNEGRKGTARSKSPLDSKDRERKPPKPALNLEEYEERLIPSYFRC